MTKQVMRILYTPAGDSDPVRDCYDGAILHIIRHYRPDKAIIFLTAEMAKKEEERQIYSKGVKFVLPSCECSFIKTDIHNPQRMDELVPLADEFTKALEQYPDAEFLLNLSSGTPQMKSVMSFLATDFDNVRAIQVESPRKGSNKDAPAVKDRDDIDEVLKSNIDNDDSEGINRCREPQLGLLRRYSVRHQIISLVKNYEYRGAMSVLKKNESMFSDLSRMLLEHAQEREAMRTQAALSIIKDVNGGTLLSAKNGKIANLYEFLMIIELRRRKGQLAEFMVKITPFLHELVIWYFKNKLSFRFEDVCYDKPKDDSSSLRINASKLQNHPDPWIRGAFSSYKDGDFLSFSKNLDALEKFPEEKQNIDLLGVLKELRSVEKTLRNAAAHNITEVSEETIRKVSKKPSKEIVEKLRRAFDLVMEGQSYCKGNIYDQLNAHIIKSLSEFRA